MKLLWIVPLFSMTSLCFSQTEESDLESIADDLIQITDDELSEDQLEMLTHLLAHPININKATEDEIRFLFLLNEKQLQNLLKYRTENGLLLSIHELQSIDGFSPDIIRKIAPYITLTDPANTPASIWKKIITPDNLYLVTRYERILQRKKGFEADSARKFEGSPDKMYIRFRNYNPASFSYGFTVEKDEGEKMRWDPAHNQFGFDYTSFHFQLKNRGKLSNIILGDYQMQFGQGLSLGGGFGLGKGGETVLSARRSTLGFLPYTSALETGMFRGAAVSYSLTSRITASAFFSSVARDANIDTVENAFITSFQQTGYHRNEAELLDRKNVREQYAGAVIQFQKDGFQVGITSTSLTYNIPVKPREQPYNQYQFTGSELINTGLYTSIAIRNASLYGEIVHTLERGTGIVAGVTASLASNFDITIHLRNFDRDFTSKYSNAFSESTLPQNEQGIYYGWKYAFNRRWQLVGYVDFFSFPWLRFRSYSPSDGHEWLLRINYKPSRHTVLFFQLREEKKDRNIDGDDNTYAPMPGIKHNCALQADYGNGEMLRWKTRLQFSSYQLNNNRSRGMTLVQDVDWKFKKLTLTARYAIFDTDDYDNRQYVYERNVWLAYSLPAYAGRGVRKYVMATYKFTKRVSMQVRYSVTRYTDRDEVGSNLDATSGDTRSDIKFQLKYAL